MSDKLKNIVDSEEEKENLALKNKMDALAKKINDLESENKRLSEKVKTISIEYEEKSNLEKKINDLKQNIIDLENEKKIRLGNGEELNAKQGYVSFLEKEISNMENTIENLNRSINNLETEKKIISRSFEKSIFQEKEDLGAKTQIRRACPKCGNKIHSQIREIVDKTYIISNYPRLYGKKYQCGMCGEEWKK